MKLPCPTPSSGDRILAAQTSTLIGAETSIKTIAAVHSQCRSWVISGQTIAAQNPPLSALVQKRTNADAVGLSVKCQKQKSTPVADGIRCPGVACEPRDALISACIFPDQEASHADRNRY